jgi:tetratricopeptide (TPR) repeat protein
VGDLELACWALVDVGVIYRVHGELGRSAQYLERALQLAERQGNAYVVICLLQLCAEAAVYSDDWVQARRLRDRAEALSRQTDISVGPSIPLHRLHLAEGDWERAAGYMASDQLRHAATLERNRAELELAQGQPAAARDRLRALLAGPQLTARVPDHLQLLAQAHLACGEVGAAAQTVARAVDVSRRDNCRLMLLDALRVQALVLIRQERWADAMGVLEEGLALARALPYPYAEARLLQVSGELHGQKGELEVARERREAALAIFRGLGAHRDVAQTELAATSQKALV